MLPPLASVEELEARLVERLETSDMMRAEALLDDASALIRAEAGTTWVDEAGVLSVPDVIVTITIAVVRRALSNPDAVTSEAVGGVSHAFADSSSDVYLKAAERKAIRRATGRSGAGSIDFETPWNVANTVYVPVSGGGDPMPWYTEP